MFPPPSNDKQGGVAVPETYTRIVVINVLQARSLLAADSNGFSDAFATLQLEGAISAKRPLARTKVKKKTLNPKWDETFRIPVIGRVGLLKLQVFDYDLTSANDFLGAAFKRCDSVRSQGPIAASHLAPPTSANNDS